MNEQLFDELLTSIREAGHIKRGEMSASKIHEVKGIDVQRIREMYRMTQKEFASFVGISIDTLRNWEQKRRNPHGPAKVLLRLLEEKPEAFAEYALRRIQT